MKMMGACKRMGVWVGVGMSAVLLAIPACLLLVCVAMVCMWVLGLLSVMKLVLRLMWNPRIGSMEEEEGGKLKKEKKTRRKEAGISEEEIAQMRLSLFQQYLEDQLNTLGDRLAHPRVPL